MRVIYIDILLFLNFYITYFLIAGTCCFIHRHSGVLRRVAGSAAGALSSLVILLPALPVFFKPVNKACHIIRYCSFIYGIRRNKNIYEKFRRFFCDKLCLRGNNACALAFLRSYGDVIQ